MISGGESFSLVHCAAYRVSISVAAQAEVFGAALAKPALWASSVTGAPQTVGQALERIALGTRHPPVCCV
jgi:hypothetical protein